MVSLHSPLLSSSSIPFSPPSLSSPPLSPNSVPSCFPFLCRSPSRRRLRLLAVHHSSDPLPKTLNLNLLDLARNSLSLLIFSLSLAALPLPSGAAVAYPAPEAVVEEVEARSGEHEFSEYTKRLMAYVAVLLKRIEEVKSGKGEMSAVNEALEEVRKKRMEILEEVIMKVASEVNELERKGEKVDSKMEDALDSLEEAEEKIESIVEDMGMGTGDAKVRKELERLEAVIEESERKRDELLETFEEIDDEILRKEALMSSTVLRELAFIAAECTRLVERFCEQLTRGGTERYTSVLCLAFLYGVSHAV